MAIAPEINTELGVTNNPIIFPLEDLYREANLKMPTDLQVLAETHALYLVELGVHVLPGEHEKIEQVFLKAIYDDNSITTVRMFPTTEWQTRFGIGFNGEVQISPALDFFPKPFSATAKDTHAEFIFHFGYSWKYPVVISAGIADKFCQWLYDHRKSELAGDIPLYVIIQTDKLMPSTGMLINARFLIKVKDAGTHIYYANGHPQLSLAGLTKAPSATSARTPK